MRRNVRLETYYREDCEVSPNSRKPSGSIHREYYEHEEEVGTPGRANQDRETRCRHESESVESRGFGPGRHYYSDPWDERCQDRGWSTRLSALRTEPYIDDYQAIHSSVSSEASFEGQSDITETRNIPGRGSFSYVLPLSRKHELLRTHPRPSHGRNPVRKDSRSQQESCSIPMRYVQPFPMSGPDMSSSDNESQSPHRAGLREAPRASRVLHSSRREKPERLFPRCERQLSRDSRTREAPQGSRDVKQVDIEWNAASRFRHPPIDHDHEIRLIQIAPSSSSTTIICSFAFTEARNPDLPYTCLSYMWGEAPTESDVVQILLQGQPFWIRRNLWTFLKRARAHPVHQASKQPALRSGRYVPSS